MADKEATVYIIDLGSSMADCSNGREESNLDFGMKYVWDKICTTTAASRKTWMVGVLGFSTEETKHDLAEDDGYNNISVLKEIDAMSMAALRSLRGKIKPCSNASGDAISAIIVAVDMISKAAPKRLKYKRKIILVTDGQGPLNADDLGEISNQINDLGIELIILGIDFDDAEYGFKEEDKAQKKAENEEVFHKLVAKCEGGVIGTMAEAVDELEKPRLKPVRPYRSYEGPLTLGDPKAYDGAALSINVERYATTKVARPPPASTVVMRTESGGPTQSTDTLDAMDIDNDPGHFASVKQNRNYIIKDPNAPGGERDVDFDELDKGYTYGRTAVHISETDKNVTQLTTVKSFSIVGFVPSDRYERMLNMGETCMIVSRSHSEKDELTLSALIHTLYELESMAVARLVLKDMKEPLLVLLIPSIEPGFECLYDVPLPFAEDVRPYQFPPLDKVITIDGKTLTKHRNLPTDELNQAMSDYVDAMDISEYGVDDEGNAAEFAPMEDSFSPMIHRVNQAIRSRALNPEPLEAYRPPSEDKDVLTRFSRPPNALVEKKQREIEALIKAADLKKVLPKVKGKGNYSKEQPTPVSGKKSEPFDVMSKLVFMDKKDKGDKVSVENAVPQFKHNMRETASDDDIDKQVNDMGDTVRELITNSTGTSNYERALENIHVLRESMVDVELPKLYNDFLGNLKADIKNDKLGVKRSNMWYKIINAGLGLITTSESEASDLTDEEAFKFAPLT